MPFKILPVENDQADRDMVAECLMKAMWDDAYYRTIYPSTALPDLIRYASLRLGSNLQMPQGWFLKVVEVEADSQGQSAVEQLPVTTTTTKEIICYARYLVPAAVRARLEWDFPRRPLSAEEKVRYAGEAVEGSNGEGSPKGINERLLDVVGPVMEKAREAFAIAARGRQGMTLDMLATLPSHQHHGAASAIVKWGTDLADSEGLLVFLEATDGNQGFYSKFGFEKVSEARHDLRPWGGEGIYTHTFMVREPKAVLA